MDEVLRSELMRMQIDDLSLRRELIERGVLFDGYHPEMAELHRRHNARMREILAQVGWPGIKLVGEDGCEAAWQIVQHGILDPEMQRQALALLEDAVRHGDAPAWQMAMLTDRVLIEAGEPQVYGSILVPGADGLEPWTIRDADGVEARRASVGLPPLSEHLAKLRHKAAFERRIQEAVGVSIDAERFGAYVGLYRMENGQEIAVTLEGDQLIGQLEGQPPVLLIPENAQTFLVREGDATIRFVEAGLEIEMLDQAYFAEKLQS